jgi:hypothetical protein
MKKLYMFFLLIFSSAFVNAQDPIEQTAGIIQSGEIQQLAKTFAPTVELAIPGAEDSYPAAKAAELLEAFFKQNQPRSVKILHRIISNPNYRFAVLLVSTSNGNYRMSFNLKNKSGHFELNDVHIESQRQNSP